MGTESWIFAVINAAILAVYAWFTYGIWRETSRTATRTEEMARQARDAFILQMLAILTQQVQSELERENTAAIDPDLRWFCARSLWNVYREFFPDQWQRMEFMKVTGKDIASAHAQGGT